MADFNKIGLLLFSPDRRKFLVCAKNYFTTEYILPGGKIEPGEADAACLRREIKEELSVDLKVETLQLIGKYEDVAAGDHTKTVSIVLYEGTVTGTPQPTSEIIELHWIGAGDIGHPRLSTILRRHVLPDLIKRKMLA